MYKLLYVLVSTDKDLYCEQCMISIMSARRNSPKSKIALLLDEDTEICLKNHCARKKIFDMVDECVSVPRPQNFSGMETSRYLKTSMRKFIKGDFLYIDSDTIVSSPLDDVENVSFDFGAVLDQHMNLSQSSHAIISRQHIVKVSGIKELGLCERYFNGGVLWVRDCESNYKFFEDWNKNWMMSRLKGIKTDMPALMLTNYQNENSICELGGEWNCQVWFGVNYLSKAKIIHYFTSIETFTGGYGKFSVDLPMKIKRGELLDEQDWTLIQNARCAFPSPNAIITGSDYEIYRSSLCGILRALYRKKRIFDFLEKMLVGVRIFRANILRKNNNKK